MASQVGGFTEEVTTAVGCAIGQTIGKVGTVLALRQGRSSRLVRKVRDRPRKPAGRVRTKLRAWSDRMMGLLGERRWGVPIVLLSACVGLPPLYAVTLAVPSTKMSVILFGAAVLLGRMSAVSGHTPSGGLRRCSLRCPRHDQAETRQRVIQIVLAVLVACRAGAPAGRTRGAVRRERDGPRRAGRRPGLKIGGTCRMMYLATAIGQRRGLGHSPPTTGGGWVCLLRRVPSRELGSGSDGCFRC